LASEAVSALERASELLEQEFEHSESADVEHRYLTALLNLGRVRLVSRAYQPSLDAFTNCFELLSGSQHPDAGKMRIQARLGQGLAQFWVGQVDESLEAFQGALDECSGQEEKEVVAVLLARTLWGLGGDDAKDLAKSQLMEWYVHSESPLPRVTALTLHSLSSDHPSIRVISTLAAVAITSSDADLTEAAISELHQQTAEAKLAQDPAGQADLVLFLHSLALESEESEAALSILESAVQIRPTDPIARNRLAKALVATGRYDEASIILDGVTSRDGQVFSEALRLKGVAQAVSGESSGLEAIQKSVVVRPWDEAGWEALAWTRKAQAEVEVQ
jgi:superkiller protein 3